MSRNLPDPLAPIDGHAGRAAGQAQAQAVEARASTSFPRSLLVTILWLIVTAPLSRALEPLADPAMLLVSSEGRPIARRGAIKDTPVESRSSTR